MLVSASMLALLIFTGRAQTTEQTNPASGQSQNAPKAVFKEKIYDFGEVNRGDQLSHTFIVENEGTGPLNILNVNPG
jgi:hypothetical protein